MKKNTLNINLKNIFPIKMFFFFLLLTTNSTFGQGLGQQGILYVDTNTVFYVGSNTTPFTFGASPAAATTTFKPTIPPVGTDYGKITFADGVGLSGAGNPGPTGHFVDGYVSSFSTGSFTFPIGAGGRYRPATLTGITANTQTVPLTNPGIDAAYWATDPRTIFPTIAAPTPPVLAPITAVSKVEFWQINSTSATAFIQLDWDSNSYLQLLTANILSYVSIVGWNGTKWVEIPSTIVSGDLTAGTIKSDFPVTLANFQAITFGVSSLTDCGVLPTPSGITKTWNGSAWDTPGAPTIYDDVVIGFAYPAGTGGFKCNSLLLNADVNLNDTDGLEIVNGVTGMGKIIMSNTSSVIQRNGSALTPTPTIHLTKQTRLLRRDDYTYFGSPIDPINPTYGNLIAQLSKAHSVTVPSRLGALNGMYSWLPGNSPSWQYLTTISKGVGFIAKITNQTPFCYNPPAGNPPETYSYADYCTDYVNVPIKGTANNGDVTVNIVKSSNSDADFEGNYNLVANPYPSALYADLFLEENPSTDGVVYLWRATSQNPRSISFNQSDYVAYTKLGATYNGPFDINNGSFDGMIASGQGFKVRANASLAPGTYTATFTNCMRLLSPLSNTNFQKTKGVKAATKKVVDRFKLTLTNINGVYSQILIGYLPECTYQYDRMYDAPRNSASTSQLFTTLEDGQKLAINGRPSFTDSDEVALGVTKTGTALENYTISISDKEGIFTGSDVKVYLHDKTLGEYHNFENGDYTFSTNVENVSDRFSVVYKDANTLTNQDFNKYGFVTYIKNEVLYLNSINEMAAVEVYDLTGRIIDSFKVNGVQQFNRKFNNAESVYIVKVKFVNGLVGEQKLINKK